MQNTKPGQSRLATNNWDKGLSELVAELLPSRPVGSGFWWVHLQPYRPQRFTLNNLKPSDIFIYKSESLNVGVCFMFVVC